jgi:hypothetical protein
MMEVIFKFSIGDFVKVDKTNFSGIVTMCALDGDPGNPDKKYYVAGTDRSEWYTERLIEEVK